MELSPPVRPGVHFRGSEAATGDGVSQQGLCPQTVTSHTADIPLQHTPQHESLAQHLAFLKDGFENASPSQEQLDVDMASEDAVDDPHVEPEEFEGNN